METSADDVRSLRARKQYLQAPAEPEYLREVVGALGINAQRPSSMLLSLRARVHGLELNHVEEAIAKRMLVRTWAMRGTIHLLDGEDVRWMLALLGPIFLAAGKRRRGELGLSEEVAERGLRLIREALKGKEPLTRWEIMDILEERGFSLDRTSQAPIHFIRYAQESVNYRLVACHLICGY